MKNPLNRSWIGCEEDDTVIFDTDLLIWAQRGNRKAAAWIDRESDRRISLYTYLELMQGASRKEQHMQILSFLRDFDFVVLPLTERIGHRAAVYIEEYALSHGLRAGDAIVAATAAEHHQVLATGNKKHFGAINELQLKVFRP